MMGRDALSPYATQKEIQVRHIALLFAIALNAEAQISGEVGDSIGCPICSIEVRVGPQIATLPGRFELTPASRVSRLDDGRWVVTESADPGMFGIYSALGAFERTVQTGSLTDRSSRMPQVPATGSRSLLYVADDELHVMDARTWLTLAVGRPFGTPSVQVHAILSLKNETAVVQAALPGPAPRGGLYHIVGPDATIRRSFGAPEGVQYFLGFGATRRRIAARDDSSFWSVPPNDYTLTLLDTAGTTLARLRRASSWFVQWSDQKPSPSSSGGSWETTVQGVSVDSHGLIWVVLWVPAVEPVDAGASLDRIIDSVVEVIDPQCGVLLARRRFDEVLYGFPHTATSFTRVEGAVEGRAALSIWSFNLRGRPQDRRCDRDGRT